MCLCSCVNLKNAEVSNENLCCGYQQVCPLSCKQLHIIHMNCYYFFYCKFSADQSAHTSLRIRTVWSMDLLFAFLMHPSDKYLGIPNLKPKVSRFITVMEQRHTSYTIYLFYLFIYIMINQLMPCTNNSLITVRKVTVFKSDASNPV